jgi:hypothetical protein
MLLSRTNICKQRSLYFGNGQENKTTGTHPRLGSTCCRRSRLLISLATRHGRWPSLAARGRSASAEKLDCDLRGHLFQGPPDFLGGVCQPVRVDVNSDATAVAAHVSALLQTLDRLLELMPALRALEFDQMRVTHGAGQRSAGLGISAESVTETRVVGTSQEAIVTSQGCPRP